MVRTTFPTLAQRTTREPTDQIAVQPAGDVAPRRMLISALIEGLGDGVVIEDPPTGDPIQPSADTLNRLLYRHSVLYRTEAMGATGPQLRVAATADFAGAPLPGNLRLTRWLGVFDTQQVLTDKTAGDFWYVSAHPGSLTVARTLSGRLTSATLHLDETEFAGQWETEEQAWSHITRVGQLVVHRDASGDYQMYVSTGTPGAVTYRFVALVNGATWTREEIQALIDATASVIRQLPAYPAEGDRDNKVPKFDGNTLNWEVDAGDTGGARDDTARNQIANARALLTDVARSTKAVNEYLLSPTDDSPIRVYRSDGLEGIRRAADLDGNYWVVIRDVDDLIASGSRNNAAINEIRVFIANSSGVGTQVDLQSWTYITGPLIVPVNVSAAEEAQVQAAISTTPGFVRFALGFYRDNVLVGSRHFYDLPINARLQTPSGKLPEVSQADAEAGTSTTFSSWSPQRVAQAIAALSAATSGLTQNQVLALLPPFLDMRLEPAGIPSNEYPETLDLLLDIASGDSRTVTDVTLTIGLSTITGVRTALSSSGGLVRFTLNQATRTSLRDNTQSSDESRQVTVTFTRSDSSTFSTNLAFLVNDPAFEPTAPEVSQADAEAGTSTTFSVWSPQRVAQAIAELAGGGLTQQQILHLLPPFHDIRFDPPGVSGTDLPNIIRVTMGVASGATRTVTNVALTIAGQRMTRGTLSNLQSRGGVVPFTWTSMGVKDNVENNLDSTTQTIEGDVTFTFSDGATSPAYRISFLVNDPTFADPPEVAQADAEAGTSTTFALWSPERVAQAIAALETAPFVPRSVYTGPEIQPGATTWTAMDIDEDIVANSQYQFIILRRRAGSTSEEVANLPRADTAKGPTLSFLGSLLRDQVNDGTGSYDDNLERPMLGLVFGRMEGGGARPFQVAYGNAAAQAAAQSGKTRLFVHFLGGGEGSYRVHDLIRLS